MLLQTLTQLFERDLNKLIQELELYHTEENIWQTEHNIANSAGNLTLHLIGNLNTYIGKIFGHTGYVRNRALEFSQKNVSRDVLIENLKQTIAVVNDGLQNISSEDLSTNYPMQVLENETTTEYFLIHLSMHLAYHLGQVNYHRRLIDV